MRGKLSANSSRFRLSEKNRSVFLFSCFDWSLPKKHLIVLMMSNEISAGMLYGDVTG